MVYPEAIMMVDFRDQEIESQEDDAAEIQANVELPEFPVNTLKNLGLV
jgi:metal-sulfur cluster biosynthetic enzyme